jgi:Tfp pilus assembly protein PilF
MTWPPRKVKTLTNKFAYLERALALNSNHTPVYMRLVSLYQQKPSATDAEKIKTALMESVAGDKPSAMAHFALSNFLWAEGNHSESEWHVEQAYKLQPGFAVVLNNLAWMLAHKEEPDLERAFLLAKTAVKQAPNDPHCLGTYGTVLMIQKKYEEAIIPLQKALPNNRDAKAIHEALAKCHQELGKSDLANIHLKKASGPKDKLEN